MKIKYFQDTDTLYIELRTGAGVETKDLDENTQVDLDRAGNICAITIEHAKERAAGRNLTSARRPGERVRDVRFTDDLLVVDLLDGRTISVPLAWYPRLLSATPAQRANWRVAGGGFGIHWPDVDEDLSTEGLLRGAPAPRGSAAAGR